MTKYSFIVPVYNCEKYLEACVLSILKQNTENDLEIILVNDGSQDKSGEIADRLSDTYINVCTFHKENGGAASARNRGLCEAKGKYILFIDGDDTLDHDLLKKIDSITKKEEQMMIIYGMSFDYFRHEKLERSDRVSCSHEGKYNVEEVFEEYKSFFDDNALSSACNKVFLAEIIETNNLRFNERMMLYEDYDFVLRYLIHIEKIYCIAAPLYHYRHDLENIHFNSRIQNLNKLRLNLQGLLTTSIEVSKKRSASSSSMQDVTGNLYMQLLVHNMMNKKYSTTDLKLCLTDYCSEPLFRKILKEGVELQKEYLRFLDDIDAGRFWVLKYRFMKKRFFKETKRILKRMLRITRTGV